MASTNDQQSTKMVLVGFAFMIVTITVAILIGVLIGNAADKDTAKTYDTMNRLVQNDYPDAHIIQGTGTYHGGKTYSAHVDFGGYYRNCDFPGLTTMVCSPDKVTN